MARKPKPIEVDEREVFVTEYLVDFDPIAAALRCGVPRLQAKAKAKLWMQDRVVLCGIQEGVDKMLPEQIATPQRILAGLMRESRTAFLDGVRVQALTAAHAVLSDVKKQKKLDEKDENEKNKRKNGRAVLMVPGTPALTDWEAAAREQQAKLKEKAKE